METRLLKADATGVLDRALEILRTGGIVAFPTDTVYGLGALAFDDEAVRSLYAAKGRELEKAIPILLADAAGLERVSDEVPLLARRLAARFWPGPVTLIVRKNPRVPNAVSASDTVGARVPDHPVVLRLLQAAGPMAVTSANASGQPSPTTAKDVLEQLHGWIPLILDGGRSPGGIPSTVIDCTKPEPIILRAGPVTLDDIRAALQ
jgi:L-threonylcarbamoyladenylate synthase